jgi:hypothetical protein
LIHKPSNGRRSELFGGLSRRGDDQQKKKKKK